MFLEDGERVMMKAISYNCHLKMKGSRKKAVRAIEWTRKKKVLGEFRDFAS